MDANVINLRKQPPEKLKCPGVGRDAENDRALIFSFSRRITDDEMRFLHEVMQRAVACSPDPLPRGLRDAME